MSSDTALRSMPTISRAAMTAAEQYGSRPALRYLSAGAWHTDTFAEVGEAVESIACGLVSRGIETGDRVCLLANTRREWTIASLAISRAGAVVVPMYPTKLPGGVRVGGGQFRRASGHLRGRGAGGEDRTCSRPA